MADSLRGNLLRYSSPEYVRKLHRGAVLAEWAVVIALLSVAGTILGGVTGIGVGFVAVVSLVMPLVYAGMSLGGWWLLSSPDPSLIGEDAAERVRRVLRASLVVTVAGALGCAVIGIQHGGALLGVSRIAGSAVAAALLRVLALGTVVAWLMVMVASMRYLMMLALRIPDADLVKAARRVLILISILAVSVLGPEVALLLSRVIGLRLGQIGMGVAIWKGCATALLATAALAMYGNLMHRVREVLKAGLGLPRGQGVGRGGVGG